MCLCLCVSFTRRSLHFLVRVFSFFCYLLCYPYFGTLLSTWSPTCVYIYIYIYACINGEKKVQQEKTIIIGNIEQCSAMKRATRNRVQNKCQDVSASWKSLLINVKQYVHSNNGTMLFAPSIIVMNMLLFLLADKDF